MNWIDSTLISVEPSTEETDLEVSDREVDAPSDRGKASHLITKALAPALQLWLRSQLERIEQLSIKLEGRDRQILQGRLPKVEIAARGAVYQGLHLSQIHLMAENIRINLGQVLRGHPFRLLEPIQVSADLSLQATDLNASLQAPILANALSDFLLPLFKSCDRAVPDAPIHLKIQEIAIAQCQLMLSGHSLKASGETEPWVIQMGLHLAGPRTLEFVEPQLFLGKTLESFGPCSTAKEEPVSKGQTLETLKIDLGADVDIQVLQLAPGQLMCRGAIAVRTET